MDDFEKFNHFLLVRYNSLDIPDDSKYLDAMSEFLGLPHDPHADTIYKALMVDNDGSVKRKRVESSENYDKIVRHCV